MKKSRLKSFVGIASAIILFGALSPTAAVMAHASEITSNETSKKELSMIENTVIAEDNQYIEEEQRSEQALEIIEEKYAEVAEETSINSAEEMVNSDEYTLTAEDEARIDQATIEYLNLVGYSPRRLRGFGRHWWNSRSFVGSVIDVAFIVLGFGAGVKSASQAMKIIRANRRNITRAIEKQLKARIGISIGSWLSAGLDVVGALSGVSLGYAVAWGIDYVDGRRIDGYILA